MVLSLVQHKASTGSRRLNGSEPGFAGPATPPAAHLPDSPLRLYGKARSTPSRRSRRRIKSQSRSPRIQWAHIEQERGHEAHGDERGCKADDDAYGREPHTLTQKHRDQHLPLRAKRHASDWRVPKGFTVVKANPTFLSAAFRARLRRRMNRLSFAGARPRGKKRRK